MWLLVDLMLASGKKLDQIKADLSSPFLVEYKSPIEREIEYLESLNDPNRPFWVPPPMPPSGVGCSAWVIYLIASVLWAGAMLLLLKFLGGIFK